MHGCVTACQQSVLVPRSAELYALDLSYTDHQSLETSPPRCCSYHRSFRGRIHTVFVSTFSLSASQWNSVDAERVSAICIQSRNANFRSTVERAFDVAAARVWNELPRHVTFPPSRKSFLAIFSRLVSSAVPFLSRFFVVTYVDIGH